MTCFKLTAPRTMGKIPKGFIIQVPSAITGGSPTSDEVKAALQRAGFTDRDSLSWSSSGNWIVEKMN